MIKPDSLAALFVRSEAGDELMIGRICRALVGGELSSPLTAQERMLVGVIADDASRLDGRVEANRKKERERKQAYRKSVECPAVSQGQDGTPDCPRDISVSHTNHPSIPSSIPSSNHPSIPSSNQPNIKNRIGTDTRGRACASAREGGSSGSGSGSGRGEMFGEMMGWDSSVVYGGGPRGDMTALDLYHAAFGPGWSSIRRQLGESADERMLDELAAFISEWHAGENRKLMNPAGAMMKRLQRWLTS